ncbi:MAG: hypothetical protein DRI57_29745, partial [Deltaproteobacteria bacterium]
IKYQTMNQKKSIIQIIWGIALILAGVGIFCVMPQRISQMETMDVSSFYIYFTCFCFALIAVLLLGGGSKKIYDNCQNLAPDSDRESEDKNKKG